MEIRYSRMTPMGNAVESQLPVQSFVRDSLIQTDREGWIDPCRNGIEQKLRYLTELHGNLINLLIEKGLVSLKELDAILPNRGYIELLEMVRK